MSLTAWRPKDLKKKMKLKLSQLGRAWQKPIQAPFGNLSFLHASWDAYKILSNIGGPQAGIPETTPSGRWGWESGVPDQAWV